MNGTIKTEQEGVFEQTSLDNIQDYLHNIADISNGGQDFTQKVAYGLTDETNGFEAGDQATLEEWYHRVYLEM